MTNRVNRFTLALVLVPLLMSAGTRAQEPAPAEPAQSAQKAVLIPLQIEVVVSKYQGEKRTSSLPYLMSVNANASNFSRLRMGAEVPVPNPNLPLTTPDGKPSNVNYRAIGTNIDCLAKSSGDGRFELDLRVEESSVYMGLQGVPETPWVDEFPVFRSFQSTNTLVLTDGQATQFTAATDRVTGEITRIEVTLRVVK